MSKTILIGSTPIEIPTTNESPNWGPAMVAFMEAASQAINLSVGPYDVAPQVINIDTQNINPNSGDVAIAPLSFPSNSVRAATIFYSVYRETDSNHASEQGTLEILYDVQSTPVWQITRDYQGEGYIGFSIDAQGQMYFNTTYISGTNHTGRISIYAKAVLQD